MNKLNSLFWVCLPGYPAFSLSLGCFLCLGCSFFPWLCAFWILPISTASPSMKSPFPYSSRPRESHFSLDYIIISQLSWHFTFCLALRLFYASFPIIQETPLEGRMCFWFLVAFPISCGLWPCTLRLDYMFNKRLTYRVHIWFHPEEVLLVGKIMQASSSPPRHLKSDKVWLQFNSLD